MITAGDGWSLAATLLVALWVMAGWRPVGSFRRSTPAPWTWTAFLGASAGLLMSGLGLALLSGLGVRWSSGAVWSLAALLAIPGVLALAASRRRRRADPASTASTASSLSSFLRRVHPADAVAAAVAAGATLLFAAASALRMNVHADYVYHWGQKAARYALEGGVDVEFLAAPWNAYLHPDYPSLLPALHAAAFNAAGGIGWPVTAVIATLFFALLPASLFALVEASSSDARPEGRCLAFTVATLGAVAFAVGFRQAGGADVAMAAAMTAAVCAAVRPATRGSDLDVAVIAALLAAVKLEGLPAAACLVGAHVVRRAIAEPGARLRTAFVAALRSSGPAAVAVGLWAWLTFGNGLFLESNTAAFRLDRLPTVLAGLGQTALLPDWWGLPLALVALPALLAVRRLRWGAALLLVQLAFYVYSYAAGPVDTAHWIATSAARLLFHLVPAAVVLAIIAADRWAAAPVAPQVPRAPSGDV
ncbi:MAG: hypothetical protein AAFY88_11245 [Acidobacteriota bacterium]